MVSIPKRVLEALKLSCHWCDRLICPVSIPKRVLEALKPANVVLKVFSRPFQSLKGF